MNTGSIGDSPRLYMDVKESEVPSHSFERIQDDASHNTINLGIAPSQEYRYVDTEASLKQDEQIEVQQPQSLLSKVVQWFNPAYWYERFIKADPAPVEVKEATPPPTAEQPIPEIPLELPRPISDEMVETFVKDFETLFAKTKSVDTEAEELLKSGHQSVDHLHYVLVQRLMTHYKINQAQRKTGTEKLLSKQEELSLLQTERKQTNANLATIHENRQFWEKINFGCSASLALFTLANIAVFATGGVAAIPATVFASLQAAAAVSTGGSQIITAGIKKSSESVTGDSIEVKEEIRETNDKLDQELKYLTESHRALVKVMKNIKQLNEQHYQVLMSIAAMRRGG